MRSPSSVCPHCGISFDQEIRFCGACGRSLAARKSDYEGQSPGYPGRTLPAAASRHYGKKTLHLPLGVAQTAVHPLASSAPPARPFIARADAVAPATPWWRYRMSGVIVLGAFLAGIVFTAFILAVTAWTYLANRGASPRHDAPSSTVHLGP